MLKMKRIVKTYEVNYEWMNRALGHESALHWAWETLDEFRYDHAPGARSIALPVDQQSSTLYYCATVALRKHTMSDEQ